MENKFNISCSFLKGFQEVDTGNMCGLYFKASYIDKTIPFKDRPAFKLGQWFEYMCTGATLRDGKIPEAEYTAKKELTAPYKKLLSQSIIFKDYISRNNISGITTGRVLQYNFEGYNVKGIFDVDYEKDNMFNIIDIKTSGYLNNKWEPMGWVDIEKKRFLTIQSVGYIWLVHKCLNIPIEKINFKFYVVDSGSEFERKIFDIKVTESYLEWFERQIRFTYKSIEHNEVLGWNSTENYIHCQGCELKETCEYRLFHPDVQNIYYY